MHPSQDAAECVFHQNKRINQEKIWDEKKKKPRKQKNRHLTQGKAMGIARMTTKRSLRMMAVQLIQRAISSELEQDSGLFSAGEVIFICVESCIKYLTELWKEYGETLSQV